MMTYRLIYYSANRLSGDAEMLVSQIDAILASSRRNNRVGNITGALMFSQGYFGQVLEGPQSAIEATFERIQRDRRHGDVELLDFSPTSSRHFDRWSMAFVGERTPAVADFARFASKTGFDDSALSGHRILEKLLERVAVPDAF
jgi:hypothetical protein